MFWSPEKVLMDPQSMNSYSYARNNPIINKDENGKYWETAFDVAMLTLSVNDFKNKPSLWHGAGVVFDAASILLPIPAIYGGIKHSADAAKFIKGLNKVDDVAEVAKDVNKIEDIKLLNPGIKNVDDVINNHIIPRHTDSGMVKFSDKSKFYDDVDIKKIIEQGTQIPMIKSGNNFIRTFDTGQDIGKIGMKYPNGGNPTSVVSIVTDQFNNLITAYPGVAIIK